MAAEAQHRPQTWLDYHAADAAATITARPPEKLTPPPPLSVKNVSAQGAHFKNSGLVGTSRAQ